MDRIQRALDLSPLKRMSDEDDGLTLAERPELLRAEFVRAEVPTHEPRAQEAPTRLEQKAPPAERLSIDREHLGSRRILLWNDHGAASRAYRMLRSQVLQRVNASGMRAIGIVSAVSGEGKTLTAINLAMSLAAEPNQSVSLVDLDLRRPSVAKTLGIAPRRSLHEWIHDTSPPSEVIYELEGIERLTVVPTLSPVQTSSEVLAGNRIGGLLERLRGRHPSQILIVDQPPALLSDDVLMLATQLDGYILVVTENRTRREDITRVFELLGKERLIGTVLNHSAESEQRAY